MGARQHACLGLVLAMASGCILEDNRCGENQVEFNNLLEGCVCAPNAVPNANGVGCHLCAANEEALAGACSCIAGYSQAAPGEACALTSDSGVPADAAGKVVTP